MLLGALGAAEMVVPAFLRSDLGLHTPLSELWRRFSGLPGLGLGLNGDQCVSVFTWFAGDGLQRQGHLRVGGDWEGLRVGVEGRDHHVGHVHLLRQHRTKPSETGTCGRSAAGLSRRDGDGS